VIFHSYVSLPESNGKTMRLNIGKMVEFYGEFYGSSMSLMGKFGGLS
jgi:hypothetical protein